MAEEKKADRVSEVMGGRKKKSKKSKKGGKKTKGMYIRRATSGGYIAKHDAPEGQAVGDEHVLPDMDALKAHLDDHLEGEGDMHEPADQNQRPVMV